MRITVIGRGNVGGGLARRWRDAGHEVDEIGKEGGDASTADVVLVAVPGNAIADALDNVTGLDGKVAVDATNAIGGRPEGFESLAHQVKSRTNGPTAKAFNTIFARLYDRIDGQSCLWTGDDDARAATEELIRAAGLEPVRVGGLEHAGALEDALANVMFPATQDVGGQFFYRIEPA